jgi:hypothetical protein
MDFVTGLPNSKGHDPIWVVVDRLTKMRHFVPCSTTIDVEGLANLFMTHIFRLHGLPVTHHWIEASSKREAGNTQGIQSWGFLVLGQCLTMVEYLGG